MAAAQATAKAENKQVDFFNLVYPNAQIPGNFNLVIFKRLLHLVNNDQTRTAILNQAETDNPGAIICVTTPGLGQDKKIIKFLDARQEKYQQFMIKHISGGSVFLISQKQSSV